MVGFFKEKFDSLFYYQSILSSRKSLEIFENQKVDPPVTLEIKDAESNLTGWLAIDSMINNHCCGGLRMLPDISALEMAGLAKAMTLKHGFLGIPHGGAKAGIICDENTNREHKHRLLAAFGQKIQNLLADRSYLPGPDMGTNNQDIRYMIQKVGIRVPRRALAGEKSGLYTSLSVIASLKVAATYRRLDLSKSTVAIEGFGAVGSAVAQGLQQLGCKIAAISTSQGALYSSNGLDVAKLQKMVFQFGSKIVDNYEGAERIDKEKLLELDVDILLPCARHHSITMKNASKIKVKLISSGANIPLTDEAEGFLFRHGVLCVPDFVSNSGGVIGGTMEFAGLSQSAILNLVNNSFSEQVSIIIEKSQKEGVSPRKPAEAIARNRFARIKEVAESRTLRNKAFSFALEFYRKGMLPSVCVGSLAQRYFRKRIEGRI